MAYDLIEVSNIQGKPIFLYEFELDGKYWRYASCGYDFIHMGNKYEGLSISDDGIKQTGDATSDALNITLPVTAGVAQLYIGTPPSRQLFVTIRHGHDGEPQAAVAYVGEITQANFPTPGTIALMALGLMESLDREGLRLGWQRTCPYAVYDESTCKVNKELHATVAVLSGAAVDVITSDAFATLPDGRLNGGFVEWVNPDRGRETRGIIEHLGNQVRLFGLADNMYYGLEVKAYPGCDQSREMCITLFNNLPNNGAHKHMPGISPFDGNPLY